MQIQKIKVKELKLAEIIDDIHRGRLRIPRFQRDFVWEKSKVIKLLDSIYKEYPIGSFFLWDAPQKYYKFYRDIAELNLPKPDKYEKLQFILDGQQRLTSLYAVIKGLEIDGRNYRDICFDLDERKFVSSKPNGEQLIPLSDILAEDKHLTYDNLNTARKKSFDECWQKFLYYPFSVVDVRDKELNEVCDIFERINQGGKRLSLFDLVVAGTWSEDFDLRKKVNEFNAKLANKGFGKIDPESYTQLLALALKGPCTRSAQLQIENHQAKSAWEEITQSLELAIDFLQSNLGVVTYAFLPYRGIIPMISYFFYKMKGRSPSAQKKDFLQKWFWRVTFSERYSASTLTLMTEDRKIFDAVLKGRKTTTDFPVKISIENLAKVRMYRSSAIKNGVLCLLALKRPLHLKNGSPITLGGDYFSDFNNAERHHIFPKAFVQKKYNTAQVHSLPNFCFLPAELNKEISNKKPSNYLKMYKKQNPQFSKTLKSHLIPYGSDAAIWTDDYLAFLEQRAKKMKGLIDSVI